MNIILLISDTFRYDNLFDRAAMPVHTPNLDAFTKKAANIKNAYTSSFPTIPHRTDLTSGRTGWPWYASRQLGTDGGNQIPKLLHEHGYVSQLLCDCPHLYKKEFQFGFDAALHLRGQEGDMPFLRMNHPIEQKMPPQKTRPDPKPFNGAYLADVHSWTNRNWRSENDRFAARTATTAIEWLEENYLYDPFFLWVDMFDPHEPWDPPEYLVRKYDETYSGTPMIHPNYGRADIYTEAELHNLHAHYCAEAEMVDRHMGRILEKIEDLKLDENSIVIFTSDHGMSLGEHNRTGKANRNPEDPQSWPLYPELAHIPMLISGPNVGGGVSIDDLVSPVDLFPTVCDLADIQPQLREDFHGVSVEPQLQGKPAKESRKLVVSGSFLGQKKEDIPNTASVPVVYTTDWAYVPFRPDGSPELYYLPTDPFAENDVAAQNQDKLQEMHQKFMDYLDELNAPEETRKIFTS